MIKQKHNLNLIPNTRQQFAVHCSQYDDGARVIAFRLFNGASAFTIPDGVTANIRGAKPDGNVFEYPMQVNNQTGTVSIALTDQMTVVAGNVTCEIVLLKDGNVIGTANFLLVVEPSPIDMGQFSDSDIPAIATLMNGGEIGQILTWVETGAAWTWTGRGDMMKSVYDTNDDGKVDAAEDSDTVNGHTIARNVAADEYTNAEIDTALSGKVDAEEGKGLSTNDYTDSEKNKLSGIENGAEANVQPDWNQTDTDADDYIKNKPSVTGAVWGSVTGNLADQTDLNSALGGKVDKVQGKSLSTNDYTNAEKEKLANIEAGAQVNTITGVKGDAEGSYRTGNVNITKANVGLENVDNTSDADKPISTATQTALDGKKDKQTAKASPSASGNTLSFIDTLTQNENGEITATKKTVTTDAAPTANSTNPVQSGGVKSALDNKVDKDGNKGLSTEDYTTAEKNKLAGIESGATRVIVDSELDELSGDAIENAVVTEAIIALNADLASKQSLLQVTQSISGGYLYNNYYSVS